jgi:ApaG protein
MQTPLTINTQTKFIGVKEGGGQDPVYVFSYTVTISNNLEQSATLRNRYWLITNGNGEKSEVKGEGVIGEQPVIQPNASYKYTSASMLKTEVGAMQGYYEFELADGTLHREPIPVFNLSKPNSLH